jgi:hypothetical protein
MNDRQRLWDALQATLQGMAYAERYYLTASAAAEMWAHCNGYEGAPDAHRVLVATCDHDFIPILNVTAMQCQKCKALAPVVITGENSNAQ